MKIAQRFSAGGRDPFATKSRQGRPKTPSAVPGGTDLAVFDQGPALKLKCWAIFGCPSMGQKANLAF
jgi:hypothetical protein